MDCTILDGTTAGGWKRWKPCRQLAGFDRTSFDQRRFPWIAGRGKGSFRGSHSECTYIHVNPCNRQPRGKCKIYICTARGNIKKFLILLLVPIILHPDRPYNSAFRPNFGKKVVQHAHATPSTGSSSQLAFLSLLGQLDIERHRGNCLLRPRPYIHVCIRGARGLHLPQWLVNKPSVLPVNNHMCSRLFVRNEVQSSSGLNAS